jgi:cell division protein FtsW
MNVWQGDAGPAAARKKGSSNKFGRSDRSAVGRWFWEIDRMLLLLVAVLISIGLIAVAAASPAAAQRYSGGDVSFAGLHYFYRQLVWIMVSVPVMVAVSMLPKSMARRLCLGGAAFFTVLLVFVPLIGNEVNGAKRWIGFGFAQFQPSEFLKPLFIVSTAWLLSLREQDKSLPVIPLTGALLAIIAVLLMQQPNFGETIIFAAAWADVAHLVRRLAPRAFLLGLGGALSVVAAYLFYPVATIRINSFLFGGAGDNDTYQVDSALRTLTSGGMFGTGPAAAPASSSCRSRTPITSSR